MPENLPEAHFFLHFAFHVWVHMECSKNVSLVHFCEYFFLHLRKFGFLANMSAVEIFAELGELMRLLLIFAAAITAAAILNDNIFQRPIEMGLKMNLMSNH